MHNHIVAISLNGKIISGWTAVSVNKSIDALADTFSMTLVDRWEDIATLLQPDQLCVITVDGKKLVTGYLDKTSIKLDLNSHTYKITGRSRTADLVDCSALHEPGTWEDQSPEAIILELITPFGIRATFSIDLGAKIPKFAINAGESAYDAIRRILQDRGAIVLSDADGDIEITSAGKERTKDKLVFGANILSASGDFDRTNRFSIYNIKSQKSGNGSSWKKGDTEIFAQARDLGIERYRPKLFTADSEMNSELAQRKVSWEAQVRSGKSMQISINTNDWFQSGGSLWEPNFLVSCQIDPLRITPESPLLINEVNFVQDNSGSRVTMKLVKEETYAPEPAKEIKNKKKRKKQDEFAWLK